MNKCTTLLAILSIGLTSLSTSASIVDTDWKVNGDKKSALDDETGIEWLDLKQTVGLSINDVVAGINNGQFEGWRLPSQSEMFTMLEHTFLSKSITVSEETYNLDSSEFYREPYTFFQQHGHLATTGSGNYRDHHTYGWHLGSGGQLLRTGIVFNNIGYSNRYGTIYSSNASYEGQTYDFSLANSGVWLVSDGGVTLTSINEPSINQNNPNSPYNDVPVGGIAIMLGALGLFCRRKV